MEGFFPPVLFFSFSGMIIVMAAMTLIFFKLPGLWAIAIVAALVLFAFHLDHAAGAHGESQQMNAWVALFGVVAFMIVNPLLFGPAGLDPIKWGFLAGIPLILFFMITGKSEG